MQKIDPTDFVLMNDVADDESIRIDQVYRYANHSENVFSVALYPNNFGFWLHKDLSDIVIQAARLFRREHNMCLVLKDGLRPVRAQQAMQDTDIVKAHPEWCMEPNRMLSPPGRGAHPRGMAVDLTIEKFDGAPVDMGTVFDDFSIDPVNGLPRAHRDNMNFSDEILSNRQLLTDIMMKAAVSCGRDLWLLRAEWWDFRFPLDYTEIFEPIADYI